MIVSYPRNSSIFLRVESVAELRSISSKNIQERQLAFVGGQQNDTDGRGGIYAWRAGDNTPDDGVENIRPTSGKGSWHRIVTGTKGAKGDTGGNVMAVGSYQSLRAGQMSIPIGTSLVRTSEYNPGTKSGSALYIENAEVASTLITGNMLPSPDNLADDAWSDSVTEAQRELLPDGYTRVSDTNAHLSNYDDIVHEGSPTAGQRTAAIELRKDDVPGSVREPLLILDSIPEEGYAARTSFAIAMDTRAGSVRVLAGAPDFVRVEDKGSYWRFVMSVTLPETINRRRWSLAPAGAQGGPIVSTLTGSVDVRRVILVAGLLIDAEKTILDQKPRTAFVAPSSPAGSPERGWVLHREQTITPHMFGAVDGEPDSTAAVQAFFDEVSSRFYPMVDWGGSFNVTNIVAGPASGRIASPFITGNLTLNGIGGGQSVIQIRNFSRGTFGRITVNAKGGQSFKSRTYDIGVHFRGECGRSRFQWLKGNNCRFAGIWLDGDSGRNHNFTDLGVVQGFYNGSGNGSDGQIGSLVSTYTITGTAGSQGSYDQRSLIAVSVTPSAEIFGYSGPTSVRLNGRLYRVTNISRNPDGSGTLSVYPRVHSDTPASGTTRYFFGALLHISGNNSNSIKAGVVDAMYCGTGLYVAGLFGCDIESLQLAYNGIGIALGRNLDGITFNNKISSTYFERATNTFDVARYSMNATADLGNVLSPTYSSWVEVTARTDADDKRAGGNGWDGIHWTEEGRPRNYHKRGGPAYATQDINLLLRGGSPVYNRDDATVMLEAISTDIERMTGDTFVSPIFIGSRPDGSPTGNIRFMLTGGGSINGGGSSLTFTTAQMAGGPARFVISCTDAATKAFRIFTLPK